MGLEDKAFERAETLPYGGERLVGIGRALAMAPRFVLLDEPAAGLSDAECDELMRLIARIPAEFGCGVLLIEHNMRVVMGVCQRIHVIASGRTIAEGTPEEIQRDAAVIEAYLGTQAGGLSCSRLTICTSATAGCRRCAASRSGSRRARSSASSGRTAPARPRRSARSPARSARAEGAIRLAGEPIGGLAPETIARKGVSLVPENRHVFTQLTVEENLRLGTQMRRDRG